MATLEERISLSPNDIAAHYFVQDASHLGFAMSPLFASFMVPSISEGTRRAFAALHFPLRQFLGRVHDDYFYQALIPAEGDPAELERRYREEIRNYWPDLVARFQRAVTEEILPLYGEIDAFAIGIRSMADARTALRRLEAIYDVVWELHFRLVMPAFAAQEAYLAAYHDVFPESDPSDALQLIRGNFNKSLETDRELSRLAKAARAHPRVRAVLEGDGDVLASLKLDPALRPFVAKLEAFLAKYGWRAGNSHEFVHATWAEDPRYALDIVRRYLQTDYDFDAQFRAIQTARARDLEETLARISDPEARQRFSAALAVAYETAVLDEDHHFYIDAMLPAKSRRMLLRIGEILSAAGALATPDDLFFCYLDEVYGLLDGTDAARPAIAARRAAYLRHKSEVPPFSYGTPPQTAAAGAATEEIAERSVSGVTAAQGSYRGPARIIEGPEDFSRFLPGDILVARTTTPVWTPLFAIAGAVVTDAGGMLSHTATVAREYGIPCVVATVRATRTFQDGEEVHVDASPGRGTARALA